jgi:putative transposase
MSKTTKCVAGVETIRYGTDSWYSAAQPAPKKITSEFHGKTFRYRLKLNHQQEQTIDEWIETTRWLYNKTLDYYIKDYRDAQGNFYLYYNQYPYHFNKFMHDNKIKKITIPAQMFRLGSRIRHRGKGETSTYRYYVWLKKHAYPEIMRDKLNELPATVAQGVLERVDSAFQGLFRGGGGYPKFKRKGGNNSITWSQSPPFSSIKSKGDILILPKFGDVKLIYHRPLEDGIIKRVNITKRMERKYYANIFLQYNSIPELNLKVKNDKILAIDRNVKLSESDGDETREFAVCYDGEHFTNFEIPAMIRDAQHELKRVGRQASRDMKEKTLRVKRHIWTKLTNKKEYWLNELSRKLINEYGTIIVEDLSIKDMTNKEKGKRRAAKNKKRSDENEVLTKEKAKRRGFSEVAHGKFLTLLEQKANLDNVRIIKVDPRNTSKTCNVCGEVNNNLTLDMRNWVCPKCNAALNRDENAAINIYNRGIIELNKLKSQIL